MLENLLFALKTSLLITGIYASTWDGMIFGNIRAKIDSLFNKKYGAIFLSPLYGCVICMASVWGGGVYLYYNGLNFGIIEHIIITAGINTLISGIIFLAYERNTNQ